jgi:hypothetical protein
MDRARPSYGNDCPSCLPIVPNTLCCNDLIVPDTLVATLVDVSGECSCFNATVTLTKNSTPISDGYNLIYHWYGSFTCPGGTIELDLACGGTAGSDYRWLIVVSCNGNDGVYSLGDTATSHSGWTCSPLYIDFGLGDLSTITNIGDTVCCPASTFLQCTVTT